MQQNGGEGREEITHRMLCKESAVATIQQVQFWVEKFRERHPILFSVRFAQKPTPEKIKSQQLQHGLLVVLTCLALSSRRIRSER